MMHMSFWWGSNVGDVFFSGLTVNGTGPMVALCLTLTALSVAYEGLKVRRWAAVDNVQLHGSARSASSLTDRCPVHLCLVKKPHLQSRTNDI